MKNIFVLDIDNRSKEDVYQELKSKGVDRDSIYVCLITNVKMEIPYYMDMGVKKIYLKSIGDKYILVSWVSIANIILYNRYYDEYIEFLAPVSKENNPKDRKDIINFDFSDSKIKTIDDLREYSDRIGIKYETIIYAPVDTESNYIINWEELIKLGISNLYAEKAVHCDNYIMIAWKDTRGVVINSEGYSTYLEGIDKFLQRESEIISDVNEGKPKEVRYLDRLGDIDLDDESYISINKTNQVDVDYLIEKIQNVGFDSLTNREKIFLKRISI